MAERTPNINDPLQYVPGIGPKRAELLDKIGVRTVRDLLHYFPSKYHDRHNLVSIKDAQPGEQAMICGDVVRINLHRRGRGRGVLTVTMRDETGELKAVWFNQNYLSEKFEQGDTVLLWGATRFYNGLEMINPGFEHVGSDEHGGAALAEEMANLMPVYPLTEGISQGQLRPIIHVAVDMYAPLVPDVLPEAVREKYSFISAGEALRCAHFPNSIEEKDDAKRRLIYEEFFIFETAVALRRLKVKSSTGIEFKMSDEFDRRIRQLFPFALTAAQESALAEIRRDMQSTAPMNRLLQGDVGCGKTVVALYAMLLAVANKFQAAIMAPTELLAEQHRRTITRMLERSRVRVRLLTSSSNRRDALAEIERGDADIIIGTHAVIQSDVAFNRLGLVVIDEQHKFGVMQRARLRWKGKSPDVLVMTATPIPRTLALTVFGDLDVSTIRELPPGRQPVVTSAIEPKKITSAYDFIRRQVQAGRQAYIVCPLIEKSETLDLHSAIEMADELSPVFPECKIGLLHGKMNADERDAVMSQFLRGEINVLVSTIVIEVGIDVPNANVMLITHAERFGLAQLHQLRGRIGRGAEQAFCILCGEGKSDDAKKRIATMCETADGFKIAEEDLNLRGTGELFGTKQHGLPDVRIGDFMRDIETLERARDDASATLADDPKLERNLALRQQLIELYHDKSDLIGIG